MTSSAAPPTLVWLRRDLRLADHPALSAAVADGGPVIPVFVLDPETEALGSASQWRLGRALHVLADRLEQIGSRLILRRGPALDCLRALARETGAGAVRWTRLYAPDWVARDKTVKAGLAEDGLAAEGHPGHLLHEPWEVSPKAGGYFKVFTPFARAVSPFGPGDPLPPPRKMAPPAAWPMSDKLADWRLDAGMRRGADVVARHAVVGAEAALDRLAEFLSERIDRYGVDRNRPDRPGTSRLSENLTWGEISARTVWHAAARRREEGAAGAGAFLNELIWREYAWHLIWHTPHIINRNWRDAWDGFPWRGDNADAERWRRGLTGEPMVDAGMREMFVTGTMHNRVRMLVGSYLCKHLMTDWRVGLDWFGECLIDWDPASNALGWQWTAGSGPDAAPFFRVFNPRLQAEKFDPDGAYRRRFLAGFDGARQPEALSFFEAAPRSWALGADDAYPEPVVDLKKGRETALAAYERHRVASA